MNNEHPILFSGPMVRAILEGRKTQTRRMITPQPLIHCSGPALRSLSVQGAWDFGWQEDLPGFPMKCPYGVPGDVLYVRETLKVSHRVLEGIKSISYAANDHTLYRFTDGEWAWASRYGVPGTQCHPDHEHAYWNISIPSIHMPRWAARIFLEITSIRVQRLQDVSEEDAVAEGVTTTKAHENVSRAFAQLRPDLPKVGPAQQAFSELWDHINLKRGYGWDVNPWVWAITFKATTNIAKEG
jgi:hypothetical protein